MKVTLRVEPDGDAPFEATFKQAFPAFTPRKGGRAKVIYDPGDHAKIAIMDGEIYMPGVSVEKQQRSRALMSEAQAAAESGQLDEYIERRKADAMRSAGIVFSGGGAAPAEPSVVDQLTKLADLRDRGVLTDAEFQAQKAKLLAGS